MQTSEPAPSASLPERLTEDFYRWELRGRGWQLWPYPVELEPPYRPFFFWSLLAPPRATDDAQRPTATSTFTGSLLNLLREPAPAATPEPTEIVFPEPELEPFDVAASGAVVEIHVALPPGTKVTKEAAERLLLSLGLTAAPVA